MQRTFAQRRPEPELRRHTSAIRAVAQPGLARHDSLNEGRSLNSGDTADARHRRWKISGRDHAQRRPEPELRRHHLRPLRFRLARRTCTLNEGRSLNSGDTAALRPSKRFTLGSRDAQRRPEPELRRHAAVPWRRPSRLGIWDAQRRPEPELRRHADGPVDAESIPAAASRSTKAGA